MASLLQSSPGVAQFGGNPWGISFGSNTRPGSLIVVAIWWNKTASPARTISSVADTQLNGYTILPTESITSPTQNQIACALAYAYNTKGGADTVTVTLSGSINNSSSSIFEFANVQTTADPIDQHSVNTGVSTNPTAGTVTTTMSNEAAVAVCYDEDGLGSTAPTAGAGWVRVGNNAGGVAGEASEYTITGAPGLLSGNFVHITGTWVATMATFKSVGLQGYGAAVQDDVQWLGSDDSW